MRNFLLGFAVCYLFAGLVFASAMKHFSPATNLYCGVPYLTAIWPVWIAQPLFDYTVDVPSCSWTFTE